MFGSVSFRPDLLFRWWLPVALAAAWLCPGDALAGEQSPQPASTNRLRRLALPGVENGFQLTERIYSGGQPTGEAAFAALEKLGVKTLISVDGARTDLEVARRHGMRYVHLPVGYDGIGTNQAVLLAQAAATLTGSIFVHCHHGKHRGPAAAAVLCMAADGWTATEGEAWLRQAGTSPDYPGLFRAVRETHLPARETLAARTNALPEFSPPQGIVAAMVELDVRWEELLAIQEAGYRSPPAHPDLSPVHAATLLQESLREFARRPDTRQRSADFLRLADESEAAALRLLAAMQVHAAAGSSDTSVRLAGAYRAVSQSCTACHKGYRNGGSPPD